MAESRFWFNFEQYESYFTQYNLDINCLLSVTEIKQGSDPKMTLFYTLVF